MPDGLMDSVDVVAVLACAEDRAVANQLGEYLEIAGLTVVESDTEEVLPGLVVLISETALTDDEWLRSVREQRTSRLVPVRVDPVSDERIPDRLAQRQRVDVDHADPILTWSTVITALRTDPTTARANFDLEVRTRNWEEAGRPRDLLIRDRWNLSRYAQLLHDEYDGDVDIDDPRVQFVVLADAFLRRRRTRRWLTAAATLAAALGVLLASTDVLDAIRGAQRTSQAAQVTTGANIVAETPEWAAMHAAAVSIHGTEQQREAARRTLISALAQPLGPDLPNVSGGSVEAILPLADSGDPIYLVGRAHGTTEITRFDAPRNEPHWTLPVDTMLWTMAVDWDQTVLYAGGDGLVAASLDGAELRHLGDERADRLAVIDEDRLAVATWSGELTVVHLSDGRREAVPTTGQLLDLQPTPDGAAALFRDNDRYELRDVLSGEVVAEADVGSPTVARGGVFPDQTGMVVVGEDQQLWTVTAGEQPRATGIAIPERTFALTALSGERAVFGGQSNRVEVVHLPTGVQLGTICRRAIGFEWFVRAPDDATIACIGPIATDLSEVPPGPISDADGLASDIEVTTPDGPVISLEGAVIVARTGDQELRAGITEGAGTAIAVAPGGDRVLVGSDLGEVLIYSVRPRFGPGLVLAATPDGAPVTRVGWQDDGPAVETASGLRWRVADCPGCGEPPRLLEHLADRLPRCWGEDQLAAIDRDTREALDVEACW